MQYCHLRSSNLAVVNTERNVRRQCQTEASALKEHPNVRVRNPLQRNHLKTPSCITQSAFRRSNVHTLLCDTKLFYDWVLCFFQGIFYIILELFYLPPIFYQLSFLPELGFEKSLALILKCRTLNHVTRIDFAVG